MSIMVRKVVEESMIRRWLFHLLRFLANFLLPILPQGVIRTLARLLFSKSWGRFVIATQHPRQVQQANLLRILQRNRDTEYGRRYHFAGIGSIADFQKQVPLVSYDDIEPYIERMKKGEPDILVPGVPPYFARTSGTTGPAKYIPVTEAYLEEFRTARRVWYRQVAQAFPGVVRGTILTMHSPRVEGQTEGGIPFGSITISTGMIREGTSNRNGRQPTPADIDTWEQLQKIPMSIFTIEDLDSKYYLLMRFALMTQVSLMAAINPSTLVLMCRKLTAFAPDLIRDLRQGTLKEDLQIDDESRQRYLRRMKRNPRVARLLEESLQAHGRVRPVDVWPRLCGLLCWKGGSAPFYLKQFPEWFGQLPVMDYGFAATEGSFSVVLSPQGSHGVAAVTGHFLEFVPEAQRDEAHPEVLTADQLVKGQRYYVLVTGSHGLYRYDMNDIVEVVDFYQRTPRITFCHKGGNMISFTGEKVGESHVVEAVSRAARQLGLELAGFCVSVDTSGQLPGYVLLAEMHPLPGDEPSRRFLRLFDETLAQANIEYAAKRGSERLGAPRLVWTRPGAFEKWHRERLSEGAFAAHVKVPHLSKDESLAERLGIERQHRWPED